MNILDVGPFDAVNISDCLDDCLLSGVVRVVLFRLLEIVWAQVPDLAEWKIKGMKIEGGTYEMDRSSWNLLKETCSRKPLSLSMCWNSSDCLSKYILSGSKCFCKVAITTSRDISPALVVLSTQPVVQICGFENWRNAFA